MSPMTATALARRGRGVAPGRAYRLRLSYTEPQPMDPYEFFPGDPPIADLLSPLGLGIAVAMAVISLLGFGLIRWGAVQRIGRYAQIGLVA